MFHGRARSLWVEKGGVIKIIHNFSLMLQIVTGTRMVAFKSPRPEGSLEDEFEFTPYMLLEVLPSSFLSYFP